VITVFTLCSTNYLAHAKTLGDSLERHNPDYQFVIGLVDRVSQGVQPSFWEPHELIPVENLGIDGFEEMVARYDVVELNTAVKPFYIEYLYRRDPSVDAVIYLDPDILIYASLAPIVETLCAHSIVVTAARLPCRRADGRGAQVRRAWPRSRSGPMAIAAKRHAGWSGKRVGAAARFRRHARGGGDARDGHGHAASLDRADVVSGRGVVNRLNNRRRSRFRNAPWRRRGS